MGAGPLMRHLNINIFSFCLTVRKLTIILSTKGGAIKIIIDRQPDLNILSLT